MSYAQRIYLAGLGMLRLLDQAGVTLDQAVRLEFYRRIEAWCVQAQIKEGV